MPHGVKQTLTECLNLFSCSCKSWSCGRVVYRGSVPKCPRAKPRFALVQPPCLVSALSQADGTCVCALQFTQSALDCMGVEVCRLRSFLQVGHARAGSVGLCWVPTIPLSVFLRSFLCTLGWAGGVRPCHPPQGLGDLVQRHSPVLQEDQAPHAWDGRSGYPCGTGLRAAGQLAGRAGHPSAAPHGAILATYWELWAVLG